MAESTLDLEDRVDKILRSDYKLVAKAFLTKCSKDSASSMEREKGSEFFKYPDAVNRVQEVKRIPVMAFRPALEAKLRELLHKISSQEIKLCSEAAKEFSKLLKGETGGDLLRLYFNSSPDFPVELLEAWKLRHGGKRGPSCIFPLIKTILSHPEGRSRSTEIGRAIDEFCGLLIREKLDDICTVLNINEEKQQNAALSLLATMVRRGPHMGSEIANKFHFKAFAKLGEYKKQRRTRRRFVAFAISFLEVGKPGFLRSVLKQKEMYSIVLQGLGNDDEDTVASVLSTLKDKILVLDQSKVSPGLRRALFGDLTLEQLASITAREDDGIVNELAHDVLVKVCTDPSNGLMPDAKRKLIGASGRLLRLMKRLRTIDSCYHSDLLLAIVRGRPSFASAFLDEFPYNVEDIASPSWSSSISLAANLVSSVRITCSFDFLNPDQRATPPSAGSDVQTIMKCVCPRPFSRSLITKGMLHSDSLVKGGTLRFLSETLNLWDSFVTAWKLCSPHSCPGEQIQASLERDVMGEARSFFPDPQVLLTVLNSLGGSSGTQKVSLKRKRKAVLDSGLVDRKRFKRPEKDGDIVMNVVGSDKDIFSADAQMTDQADAQMVDQADAGKEALLINLLDDLRIYMHSGLSGLDGSFDVFMKLLSSSLGLPAELQRALLSVLKEYISWTPKLQIERVPSRIPPLMFKHLDVFMNLLLFSSDDEVKDLAKDLAVVAMSSTGAFDKNRSEIGGWFLFLPGYQNLKAPRKVQEGVESMSSVVISFLCDAVSTVGNHLFTQWDIVRSILSHLEGVSIGFSPLIRCILQKCVSLLNKEFAKHSLEEKTAISLYVCSTLKSLLQTQVDSKPLSCLVQSVLSKDVDGSKDSCEWRPLRMLLLFSQSLSENKPFILHSRQTTGGRAKASFAKTLGKIKERVRSISPDYIPEVVKEFSSALICATPASLLKNFASVMAVSWAFYGTSFSFLQSIAFLEVNFLGNLLKQSPDLFLQGSELTVSRIEGGTVDSEIDFADHSSITEEITSKMDTHDIESSVFFMFLEQAPFHVLLNAVMIMDNKKLSKRMSKLLLLKAAQPKSDSIELDINSILFWLSQIRSAYEVLPARVLCQRSEICLSVMNPLFSQISEQNLVSGPSSDKLLAPFANLVAQTVLCHPVVMALVESPLDCGTLPPVQNVEIFSEASLISEIDQHILDLLASTCEHFFFDERHIVRKGDLKANKSIMAFKKLVNKLLLVFSDKFELCVGSQDYAPLLQPSRLIHDLLRFISPVKLFYLARSMLKKMDEEELGSTMILSLGFDIAAGAFEMLILYSHQTASKRRVYDLLWEFEEENYDRNLIEEVYNLACRFSTSFGLVSADTCLLKVVGGILKGKHNQHCSVLHPLNLIISQIVGRTPKELIIHCINQASMTRAKILFYLVESSPLHLSIFGHHFFAKQQDHSTLTVDQFIMLLPAVLSYLASVSAKLEKPCLDINVYSNILVNGFLQWPDFSSQDIFEEKYEEILVSTTEDIDTIFDASLLGKAIRMFQYHLTESPTRTNELLKILYSMFPHTSADKEIKEVDVWPVDHMLNVAIREVAKVELARICLFPEDRSMWEVSSCVNATSPEIGSNRENLLNQPLNALVNTWECVVKLSDDSFKQNSEAEQENYLFLCKSLEKFILRSILKFLEEACVELVQLDSLPFLERLMESVLQYRFEDSKTLKIMTEIFSLLSTGKCSYAPYIQLLDTRLPPSFSSLSLSTSHTGELSSILKHLIISSPNSVGVGSCCLDAPDYAVQLEIAKTLRVLLSKCGKDSGINLKDLHFLVLSSYGATLSEIDLELDKLMHDIELIDDESMLNVSETNCLWGKAALEIREGLRFSQDASDGGEADSEENLRQRLFKDNLCVDPKICALTVLHFPHQHTAEISDNSYIHDDPISEKRSPVIARYDPAFILRFSLHSLSMGLIEPVEFASLGLLAVAFVSMSSADLGMRKLGDATLGRFLKALKCCWMKKHVKDGLMLLLSYVQNGVEEPWQRIPSVSAVFAAEASLILLDSSRKHYVPIIEFLKRSDPLMLRGIPLFPDFFESSGVEQRLWVLRLIYAGLKSEDDAQIYIRNSVLERLMRFSSTPLTDAETKGLILEVVRKSVKSHKMARHLIRNCYLLSWCSSFISMFTTKLPIGDDEELRFVVVLEIISDALASRNISEWLQRIALEELVEISSRLCRLLGGGLVSIRENSASVDLILQILYATLKISQQREMFQPHFTITMERIFQLFEAVANCDSPQFEASAERGLDTILMSTPPIGIICMDVDKLRRFLLWGTSTALRIDHKKGSKPSESPQEETMVAKFLRWLSASVILGKLYSEANDTNPTVLSETLLEYLKKRNLGGSMRKSEHVIGEAIVHLQKLVCANYGVLLPSVVFALALMLIHYGLGTESDKLIASLCCRITSPPEAIPAWRWSYYEAWKDLSSEAATDLEKMDLLHTCQHLFLIFSDMLGETP